MTVCCGMARSGGESIPVKGRYVEWRLRGKWYPQRRTKEPASQPFVRSFVRLFVR